MHMGLLTLQVAKLAIEDCDFLHSTRSSLKPVPHIVRKTKVVDFGDLDKVYVDKFKIIQDEVKRLNALLVAK